MATRRPLTLVSGKIKEKPTVDVVNLENVLFTKGGPVLTPSVWNIIVWRAPFACTVTNVRGYRVGGTGATINARRNGADLLGTIGAADGVPLLQPLLRSRDPRVARAAVRALSRIDDPAAARTLQTVMRAAAGAVRQALVAALVAERDQRVVPLLLRVLSDSQPFGRDHVVVLDALEALAVLGDDRAVDEVARLVRRRRWFARRRVRALTRAGLRTLKAIETDRARTALHLAATRGDRLLRRLARPLSP